MAIEKDLLDQLLAGRDPKDVFNKDGLVDELKKALSERILNTELDEHLDGDGAEGKSNHRNGYSKKSVLTGTSKLRRAVRTRGHFPSDDAATKLLYLVLNHAAAEWKRPPREWAEAKTQFAVMFNERFVNS